MSHLETPQFQPSLAEWFGAIGKQKQADAIRAEDSGRTERLRILNEAIDLRGDVPEVFEAAELKEMSPQFAKYFSVWSDYPCAIRLVPKAGELPKFRNRGLLLKQCYEEWFLQQDIEADKYVAEVYRHCSNQIWSATFVVNKHGVIGEMIAGQHSQLTKGDTKTAPGRFYFDFNNWWWLNASEGMHAAAEKMVSRVVVKDVDMQKMLRTMLDVSFYHGLLGGYFEATVWDTGELFFVDYNRMLGKDVLPPLVETDARMNVLRGVCAYPGQVKGVVRIVGENAKVESFKDGDILVCDNTDVRYLPLMKLAGAIVTVRGGILSHAAIVARELKKPCIVGVSKAWQALKDGEVVVVDAKNGALVKT